MDGLRWEMGKVLPLRYILKFQNIEDDEMVLKVTVATCQFIGK